MPSVCDCPFCGQPAAIPENLESDTAVRCARCEYEFSGDLALMNAVEAPPEHVAELPPELIPVRPDSPSDADTPPLNNGRAANPGSSPADVPSTDAAEALPEVVAVTPEVEGPSPVDPVASSSSPLDSSPCAEEANSETATSYAVPGEWDGQPNEAAVASLEADANTSEAISECDQATEVSGDAAVPAADAIAATVSPETGEAVTAAESPTGSPEEGEPSSGDSTPDEANGHEGHEAVLSGLGLHVPGELGMTTPQIIRRQRRQKKPVRTAIGTVLFGLLGLVTAYGLVAGISKLGLIGKGSPAAADSEAPSPDSTAAKTQAKDAGPLPEPKSYDEWPDLDDKRFSGAPNDVPASKSGRPAKRPGDRKGP